MKNIGILASALSMLIACGSNEETPSATVQLEESATSALVDSPDAPEVTEPAETSPERQAQANAKLNLTALAAYQAHLE